MKRHSSALLKLTQIQIDRFWSKIIIKDQDECWIWTAHTLRLYGRVMLFGHVYQANHVALVLTKGLPPIGKEDACHNCDNPPCCNPDHLFWGDAHDNKQDAADKKRLPHQLQPLFRGEKNPQARLIESQILEIRAMRKSQQEIADIFGIARSTVQAIRSRKLWGYL